MSQRIYMMLQVIVWNGLQSLALQIAGLTGGGGYHGDGSGYPASCRAKIKPTNSDYGLGFRPTLYVNL